MLKSIYEKRNILLERLEQLTGDGKLYEALRVCLKAGENSHPHYVVEFQEPSEKWKAEAWLEAFLKKLARVERLGYKLAAQKGLLIANERESYQCKKEYEHQVNDIKEATRSREVPKLFEASLVGTKVSLRDKYFGTILNLEHDAEFNVTRVLVDFDDMGIKKYRLDDLLKGDGPVALLPEVKKLFQAELEKIDQKMDIASLEEQYLLQKQKLNQQYQSLAEELKKLQQELEVCRYVEFQELKWNYQAFEDCQNSIMLGKVDLLELIEEYSGKNIEVLKKNLLFTYCCQYIQEQWLDTIGKDKLNQAAELFFQIVELDKQPKSEFLKTCLIRDINYEISYDAAGIDYELMNKHFNKWYFLNMDCVDSASIRDMKELGSSLYGDLAHNVYYLKMYGPKYVNQVRYYLELDDVKARLEAFDEIKVLSLGCGPANDLFALDYLQQEGKLNNAVSHAPQHIRYLGVDNVSDASGAWSKVHRILGDHGAEQFNVAFISKDIREFVKLPQAQEIADYKPNLILINYVFSDMQKFNAMEFLQKYAEIKERCSALSGLLSQSWDITLAQLQALAVYDELVQLVEAYRNEDAEVLLGASIGDTALRKQIATQNVLVELVNMDRLCKRTATRRDDYPLKGLVVYVCYQMDRSIREFAANLKAYMEKCCEPHCMIISSDYPDGYGRVYHSGEEEIGLLLNCHTRYNWERNLAETYLQKLGTRVCRGKLAENRPCDASCFQANKYQICADRSSCPKKTEVDAYCARVKERQQQVEAMIGELFSFREPEVFKIASKQEGRLTFSFCYYAAQL